MTQPSPRTLSRYSQSRQAPLFIKRPIINRFRSTEVRLQNISQGAPGYVWLACCWLWLRQRSSTTSKWSVRLASTASALRSSLRSPSPESKSASPPASPFRTMTDCPSAWGACRQSIQKVFSLPSLSHPSGWGWRLSLKQTDCGLGMTRFDGFLI